MKISNRPIGVFENRPNQHLVHSYGRDKWIPDKELEELALKKYYTNGRGITFSDVVEGYRCRKDKAQRRLKNACIEHVKNGKKNSVLFRLNDERTNPQQYFPTCIKTTIITNNRNRLIRTTGVGYNSKTFSNNPLYNALDHQQASNFLIQLNFLPFQPLNIHNIHLWTNIHKSHYTEIFIKLSFNETKIQREKIGLREVIYKFNKRGSIQIDISCSKYPFKIETDDDVNNIFVFLGQIQDRLAYILHDPSERFIPPVDRWILKSCDFNKDIEIDDKNIGQLMRLDIQVKHMGEAFRLYVKNLEDRFALRGEQVMKVNQPIPYFMKDSILNPLHLINSKANEIVNIIEKRFNEINNRIDKLEKSKSIENNFADSK